MTQTTKGREIISGELRLFLQRLLDSRIDTVGDNQKPKELGGYFLAHEDR